MSTISPRSSIPDAWCDQAHCPLCAASGMVVIHLPGQPDQLRCSQCNLAFELESGGAHMHVTRWPISLDELDGITEDWLAVTDLRALTQKIISLPLLPGPASPLSFASPGLVSTPAGQLVLKSISVQNNKNNDFADERVIRIKKLRDLGNSPQKIKQLLIQEGKSPEEIEAAIRVADQLLRQDQLHQQKKLWISLGIAVLGVCVCIVTGIILQKLLENTHSERIVSLQATLAPNIAQTLNLNTPVVQFAVVPPASSNAISGCPHSADQAAVLFGGQPANWSTPPGSNGWIMIDIKQGNTIYIPQEMTGAYLQLGDSVTLVEVIGPASLQNVYYIAVSCP